MLQIEIIKPDFGIKKDYFHPAVARLSGGRWLMTMQVLAGHSDHYGSPEYSLAGDLAGGWERPELISALQTCPLAGGLSEGVADVRVFALPDRPEILAIGCNTFYTPKGALAWDKQAAAEQRRPLRQIPVYALYHPERGWSGRHDLQADCMRECDNWRVACAQIAFTPENRLLLPVYYETDRVDFHGHDSPRFSVRILQAAWQGDELVVEAAGNVLSHPFGRGFCEPSLVRHDGGYGLTIRAEDGCGYHSCSADPLNFPFPEPWTFTDGEVLRMSSTQQHWLQVGGRLHLVYTRDIGRNSSVMRFRAPLLIARVDPVSGRLERASEQVVLPHEVRDGVNGLLGNFHCLSLPDGSGVVLDAAAFLRVSGDTIVEQHSEVWIARVKTAGGH